MLRTDRLLVALPERHRLNGRRRLRVEDLRNQDLVVHASGGRSVMHGTVEEMCREAGFLPRVRHEVAETSTLVTLVAAGLGVAVVPAPVADLGVPGVTYRPLSGRDAQVELAATVRADDSSPTLARALELLSSVVRGG